MLRALEGAEVILNEKAGFPRTPVVRINSNSTHILVQDAFEEKVSEDQVMMQNVVSQPTQAQTDEVVTMNAFSPPVHSQVSPFLMDDEPMASSKVEDFQITSLLMPHG